ncbi:CDP-alcohol phosphatidyltransferase family protein [Anaerovirgula multivorans]|uniref:CDP-alcohol phosphatidyltransferase family protein n=1 Tax=Anaerovirgula multivorans TaxID=312168 RepID=UPI001595AD81|nr:CDP-alcohol phosphatidyltransferase family protein [Anaerovirgula multivorans]
MYNLRKEVEAIDRLVPNILSVLRIILSVLLIPFLSVRIGFIIIYIVIGISDVLDGYIARKLGCESDLGAKLDSTADFVFYCILVLVFFKLYSSILEMNYQFVAIIIAIRLLNMLLTKLKYKRVVFIHTLANKISGIILYLMPMILLYIENGILVGILLIIVVLAAIEELLITIKFEKPDLNRRSIFRD